MKKAKTRHQPVRWTLEVAASEFPINPRTLAKRIKALGLEPGNDGKFSTAQIIEAVFTAYEEARARKTAAEARMAERADKKDEGSVIEMSLVRDVWEKVTMQIKARVQLIPSKLQSRLSLTQFQTKAAEQECDDALEELSKSLDYTPSEDGADEQS